MKLWNWVEWLFNTAMNLGTALIALGVLLFVILGPITLILLAWDEVKEQDKK